VWKGEGGEAHAANDGHEVLWSGLWEATRRVHLVDEEGNATGTEFLDEEMREKVIVACKVMHVHDLCRTPFGSDKLLVS
jgi:hypothetical protein